MKNFLVICSMLSISWSACAEELDSYLKMASDFKTTMVECPERIWPNFSWKSLQVVLVRPKEASSFLWSSDGKLVEIPNSQLPNKSLSSVYDRLTLDGKDTLSINLTGLTTDPEQNFRTATHEFFHFVGQQNWPKARGQRGTLYPQSPVPRIYRAMLFDRLYKYFYSDGEDSLALQKASFWFKKWKQEFPQENKSTTDQYEGTAKYVEEMATRIAHIGCSSSEQNLLNEVKRDLLNQFGSSVKGNYFELSSEGYDIGGISSIILRLIQKDQVWFQKVAEGVSPVEILLDPVVPVEDFAPDSIQELFNATAIKVNKEIGNLISQDMEGFSKVEYVRISIPNEWLVTNLFPKFFVLSDQLPQVFILPMARDLVFESTNSKVTSKTDKVFFFDPHSPCGGGFTTLVLKSSIESNGSTAKINDPMISGNLNYKEKKGTDGLTWLCGN